MIGNEAAWYFRRRFRPSVRTPTSSDRAATIPTSAGTGAGATSRGLCLVVSSCPDEPEAILPTGRSTQLPLDHLQGIAQTAVHAHGGAGLVADVHHAVLAPGVLPVTIVVPLGLVQEVRVDSWWVSVIR